MTKEMILQSLTAHKEEFFSEYGLLKIGLFGSYARDEQREDSDIDIAIEIAKDKKNIHTFLKIKREMENLFGKNVDLGIESALKPIAKEYISKEIIYV